MDAAVAELLDNAMDEVPLDPTFPSMGLHLLLVSCDMLLCCVVCDTLVVFYGSGRKQGF